MRAPVIIATNLEAFYGRGGGDFLFSHGIGDISSVIDGRAPSRINVRKALHLCVRIWLRSFNIFWQTAALSMPYPGACRLMVQARRV